MTELSKMDRNEKLMEMLRKGGTRQEKTLIFVEQVGDPRLVLKLRTSFNLRTFLIKIIDIFLIVEEAR